MTCATVVDMISEANRKLFRNSMALTKMDKPANRGDYVLVTRNYS
jgi:hypothetical protein